MPTRSNTFTRRIRVVQHSGSNDSCAPVESEFTSVNTMGDNVWYSENVPNWREAIARGDSATTSMIGSKFSGSAGHFTYTQAYRPSSVWYPSYGCSSRIEVNGTLLPSNVFPVTERKSDPLAEQRASTQLLQSLIDAQTAWRGSNFIAEFRETVKMLRHPLQGIHQHTWDLIRKTTSMKRLFRRSPSQYAELLGNAWLSWSFGVKPLASDIMEFEEAAARLASDVSSRDLLPIRGHGQGDPTVTTRYLNGGVFFCAGAVNDSFDTGLTSIRYKGAIRATPPGLKATLQNFGFTPEDIVPAVWEAIPWSFMLDYFVNVNTKIESLRWATADVAWLNRTLRNRTVRSWSPLRIHPEGDIVNWLVTVSGGAAYACHTYVERAPTVAPYPSWEFRIPGSLEKWINIAALAAGMRASRPVINEVFSPNSYGFGSEP